MEKQLNIVNRKASYEYAFISKYIAGMQLTGTEVKSVREGNVNMGDAYCVFIKDELWIRNLHISIFSHGSHNNHEPLRERKLLLKKQELNKLLSKSKETGVTIIPIRLFIADTGFIKIEIALAKGKKSYDKRESIKERDVQREISRYTD